MGWNSKPVFEESIKGETDSDEDEDQGVDQNAADGTDTKQDEDNEADEKPADGYPDFHLEQPKMDRYLLSNGIKTADLETARIRTIHQLRRVRTSLQLRFPRLMANIVRVLLYMGEEDLACYLSTFYNCHFEKDMIQNAIVKDNYKWLNYLWVFDRNFIQVVDENDKKVTRPERVSFETLFGYISSMESKHSHLRLTEEIQKVCDWLIDFEWMKNNRAESEEADDENEEADGDKVEEESEQDDSEAEAEGEEGYENHRNILRALLVYRQENLCRDYMGYYHMFLNKQLFIDAVANNNAEFISDALELEAFEKSIFRDSEVIEQMLEELQRGSKSFSLINTLLLTDINTWGIDDLSRLIDMIGEFTDNGFEDDNRLAQCASPLMIIALCAQLLESIG